MRQQVISRIVTHKLSSENKRDVFTMAEISCPGVDFLSHEYGTNCDFFVAKAETLSDYLKYRNDYGRTKSLIFFDWKPCLCKACSFIFPLKDFSKDKISCPKCSNEIEIKGCLQSYSQLLVKLPVPVGWKENASFFSLDEPEKNNQIIRNFFLSSFHEFSSFNLRKKRLTTADSVALLPFSNQISETDDGLFSININENKRKAILIFDLLCHIFSLAKQNSKSYNLLIKGENKFSVWISPDADMFSFSCKWTVAIGLAKLRIFKEDFSIFESPSPSSKELTCSVDTFLWKNGLEYMNRTLDSRIANMTLLNISSWPDIARLRIPNDHIEVIAALYKTPFSPDEKPDFLKGKNILGIINALFYCGLLETPI